MSRSLYKWTEDPADKKMETLLYYPDMETYNKLVEEKDEVLQQVKASLADLDKAAPYLSEEQHSQLRDEFLFLLDAAKLARAWTRAYFAQRMYVQDPQQTYKKMTEEALAELKTLDRIPGITYGLNTETGHRYNIDVFISKMRRRMRDPAKAREEDDEILKKIRDKMDVTKN